MTAPQKHEPTEQERLFEHVMRTRYGVNDIEREPRSLLLATAQRAVRDIESLDHIGRAYLKTEMRTTVKHEFEYDHSAELYRRG